eukprot:gene16518-18169_t
MKKHFNSVFVTSAFDASPLNTGVKYTVVFNTSGDSSITTEDGIKALLLNVSQEKLEGWTHNNILFEKNTFKIITKSIVLPVKKNEITISAEIKIIEPWDTAYLDRQSKKYLNLKTDIEHTLQRTFQFLKGFIKAIVRSFRQGSVVIEYDLIFDNQKTSSTNLTVVEQEIVSAMGVSINDTYLGNYPVVAKSFKITKATLGGPISTTASVLATWLIILIATLCLLFILLLFILWKKRRRSDEATKHGDLEERAERLRSKNDMHMGRDLNAFHGIPRARLENESKMNGESKGFVNVSYVLPSGSNREAYEVYTVDIGASIDTSQKFK